MRVLSRQRGQLAVSPFSQSINTLPYPRNEPKQRAPDQNGKTTKIRRRVGGQFFYRSKKSKLPIIKEAAVQSLTYKQRK